MNNDKLEARWRISCREYMATLPGYARSVFSSKQAEMVYIEAKKSSQAEIEMYKASFSLADNKWQNVLTILSEREQEIDELKMSWNFQYGMIKDRDQEIRRLNNSYNDLLAKCGDEEGLRLLGNSILLRDVEKLTLQLEKAEEVIGFYSKGELLDDLYQTDENDEEIYRAGKLAKNYFKNKEVL